MDLLNISQEVFFRGVKNMRRWDVMQVLKLLIRYDSTSTKFWKCR